MIINFENKFNLYKYFAIKDSKISIELHNQTDYRRELKNT